MSDLRVGFIAWSPDFKLTAAAAPPAPGTFQITTIGGPRSMERIQEEIAALEKHLGYLKSELSGHPDYRRSPASGEVAK
jgi:hypothetical protein